jgi:hypothetical protein
MAIHYPPCCDCKHLQRSKKTRKGIQMFWECEAGEKVRHPTTSCKSFEEGYVS